MHVQILHFNWQLILILPTATPPPPYFIRQEPLTKRIKKTGISNRRVAAMHKITFSQLQRAITTSGELQTHSEAHEAEMALKIAEETALEEWPCDVLYRCGSPIRLDMLKCMAAAVLEDLERRNIESASDFFNRIMDLATRTQTLIAEGAPDIPRIGCNWYKRFLTRHPALKPAYSRAMDNDCAMNNPETITEYFNVLKVLWARSRLCLRIYIFHFFR